MKFFPKDKTALNGRVFRSGLYSAAITAAVLVLAVLVNLLVLALPTKYTMFDLSEAGLYTLSDSSAQVAQGLTQDVTIYYLCETGNEDQIISKLLDKYASESSHITWEIKDPAIYPTFAAQYGAQDAASGSLILVSGEQSVVLDASDLYDYDYSDYYTTNHGEQALTDTLTDALENQNLSLTALDLLSSGSVPEDCDLLIINVPAQDFASAGALVDEMSLLRSYLSAGGKVLLTTDTYYNTPNLDAVMAEFGLTRAEGLVVEGDSGHFMNGYPYYLLPDYTSPTETTALEGVDTGRHVLLQMAQGITLTETEGVTAEALLTTSDAAYSKAAGYEMTTVEKEDGDTDGPFTLAAYARNTATEAEVIWINCGNLDNESAYQVVPGNCTFLQGCASSLAGQVGSVLIDSKALEAAPISVSSAQAAVLGLVFILILPAALLAAGAVVVILRRRK